MRIISGEARGIRLTALKGDNTRPTSDKVKESIYNIINPYVYDARFLDLFSGTGNMGLEAISRGAEKAVLVEKHRKCFSVIEENITKTRLGDRVEFIKADVYITIKKLASSGKKFDIIFMDPPYSKDLVKPCLEGIHDGNLLEDDGIIIVEHDIKDIIEDKVGNLTKYREKKYGNTMVTFFSKEENR